eukprot:CAMPEP_0174282796 /NCGR_PEP_ID=MMETSP0809-20121228/3368_1 /TAXON_ID=73025 ORGANISM="Eutreptiella gymnastica-like, Strain CCMP1594" /NCGR_SAMPLE_ID=MMETSP0809 /ASSEMBLY_ACC=CAM_ASM_000658 /LENGTH=122 /DNA_ID=CAMNT_0015377253 /DNA_START=376 /DNA_END=744 /DNA_ORIENTATION=-
MDVDYIDTYPAGAVNFQRSGGSIVPAKIVLATGAGAQCQALCQACSQKCQTSCQTLNQECSQTCCPGGSQSAAGEPILVGPVEHVQLFRVKYSRQKKWHTEPVCRAQAISMQGGGGGKKYEE